MPANGQGVYRSLTPPPSSGCAQTKRSIAKATAAANIAMYRSRKAPEVDTTSTCLLWARPPTDHSRIRQKRTQFAMVSLTEGLILTNLPLLRSSLSPPHALGDMFYLVAKLIER